MFDLCRWGTQVFVVTSICLTTPGAVSSQVTDNSIFETYPSCEEYISFLDESEVDAISECHPISVFLMENGDLPPREFTEEALKAFAEDSGVSFLHRFLEAIQSRDELAAYYWADNADRQLHTVFWQSGDRSRASLYSSVLSKAKYELIEGFCAGNPYCPELSKIEHPIQPTIDGMQRLETENSATILECLSRVDSFTVPIEHVMKSTRFKACLDANS